MFFYRVVIFLLLISFVPSTVFARTPNDTYYNEAWYLPLVHAPEAWDVTTGSNDVVVAVLDTGIALNHPDLEENIWKNTKEIPDNKKDDDGNGFVDDVQGWDFVDNDNVPEPEMGESGELGEASQAHGSVIAGIIGAEGNNSEGYTGIAWNVRIMPLRILDETGTGSERNAALAVRYATAQGADVINLSLVGNQSHAALRNAVQEAYAAGIVVVAALGNDARNVNDAPVYPACLRSEEDDWVIGVTATNQFDEETLFTNYGSHCADIAAPGEDIFGLNYVDAAGASEKESYSGPWSGTSVASPIIAGAAALLRSAFPDISVRDVRTALKLSVDPVKTISGVGMLGAGRVHIARALAVAQSMLGIAPQDSETSTAQESEEEKSTTTSEETGLEDFEGVHDSYVILGAREGNTPSITVHRADGVAYASFLAFGEGFLGGVHVASADVDGDNRIEILATPGAGGGPQVRTFSVSGALRHSFFAYDEASREGVNATFGDVDGDGTHEIITAIGAGVSNVVRIFNESGTQTGEFIVNEFKEDIRLGVTVADVDDDWDREIVVFAQSGEPRVAIYDADGTLKGNFLAFDAREGEGLAVSAGDFTDDYRDELVLTLRGDAQHRVRIVNSIGAWWGEFVSTSTSTIMGVEIAVTDFDMDGIADIVTTPWDGEGNVDVWTAKGVRMGEVKNVVPQTGAWMSAW